MPHVVVERSARHGHGAVGGSAARAAAEAVEAARSELVACARSLVATPSENPPGDEVAVADEVEQWLARVGLDGDLRRLEPAPRRRSLVWREPGTRPVLTLCGHLDTVPIATCESRQPAAAVAGRGSVDMKGAVAAMLFAVRALRSALGHVAGVQLLFVADEEQGGALGAKHVARSGLDLGAAVVVGEPSGLGGPEAYVAASSRGIARFTVTATGRAGHSSAGARERWDNASLALGAALLDLEETLDLSAYVHPHFPRGCTLTLGLHVEGGVRDSIVPDHAAAYCEVRTLPGMRRGDLESHVHAAVAETAGRLGARISVAFEEGETGWSEGTDLPDDAPVLRAAVEAVETVTGRPAVVGGFPGACDARHFAQLAGVPSLAALGPGDLALAHGDDEALLEEDLVVAAKVYALTALRFGERLEG
jgi:succinyl-diaminopimelate desuccinylase